MPNWNEILNEIEATGSTHDVVRRHSVTKHMLVIYNGIAFIKTARDVIVQ